MPSSQWLLIGLEGGAGEDHIGGGRASGRDNVWHGRRCPPGEPAGAKTVTNIDVVRTMFEAYLSQDARTAAGLLADDFVFTSPQDDHIDKAAFMQRCFPTAGRILSQEILELATAGTHGVFIMYEYELKTGGRHRNTELITVRDGKLVETQVFFGGRV